MQQIVVIATKATVSTKSCYSTEPLFTVSFWKSLFNIVDNRPIVGKTTITSASTTKCIVQTMMMMMMMTLLHIIIMIDLAKTLSEFSTVSCRS